MNLRSTPVQLTPARRTADLSTGDLPTVGFARTGLGRDAVGIRLLITLALLNAAAPLSTDMYLSGFPRMARDLSTPAPSIQLTLTTFMLGIGLGQLVIGALSDRWGRRAPLLVALVVFTAVGALCALSPSVQALIALRFVQGFSGAAGMVIGRAIVADSVRGPAAARAYSLLSMVGALAPVLAPLGGGLLLPLIGWRGIFWTLSAAGLVMIAITLAGVPETLRRHRRSSGGLAATARLARSVLGSATFLGYTVAVVATFGCLFSYVSASPFLVQDILGLSAHDYALDFAVNSTALILVGGLNARLVGRISPRRLLTVGLCGMAGVALALLGLSTAGLMSRWLVLPLLFLVMANAALVMANGIGLAMSGVAAGQGTASALIGASQFALGALVSPLVGLGGAGSAVPMALTMTVLSLLALGALAYAWSAQRRACEHHP